MLLLPQVVGNDGGFKVDGPTAFPKAGIFHGVAERYDVVCDLTVRAVRLGAAALLPWQSIDTRWAFKRSSRGAGPR